MDTDLFQSQEFSFKEIKRKIVLKCYTYQPLEISIIQGIKELANTFSLLTFSLKQPKLLFKMPPLEDASQTAMKNQKEAQFGEKAVKYFIGRLFRILGTELSKYIYFISGHTG